jgi:transposase InsO family protein
MLERAGVVRPKELSRSSVHRLLRARGVSARPARGPSAERRSFIHEHASDLWIGDALHGPHVIAPDGVLRKAYLLSQIDCATRFVVHSYFAVSEGAVEEEYGLKQALLKHGVPRAYYVDRGPAYIAKSLWSICGEIGIRLLHTGKQDAEAKGAIERWHRSWREEVGDELPDHPITLGDLNAKHWAWLAVEYHARVHDTTGRAPREHWLAEAAHLRPVPRGKNLDEVFLHREKRTVRKDGTVRFDGRLLEVVPEPKQPPEYRINVGDVAAISGGGRSTHRVQYTLSGPDLSGLQTYTEHVTAKLRKVPGAVDVDSSLIVGKPELGVYVDRAKAADLGVQVSDVANALRLLVEGEKVSDYEEHGDQYEIRVRAERDYRADPAGLRLMTVPSARLGYVPVADVVQMRPGTGPSQIDRLNRQRVVTVLANPAPGYAEGQIGDQLKKIFDDEKLPPAYVAAATGTTREMARDRVSSSKTSR